MYSNNYINLNNVAADVCHSVEFSELCFLYVDIKVCFYLHSFI